MFLCVVCAAVGCKTRATALSFLSVAFSGRLWARRPAACLTKHTRSHSHVGWLSARRERGTKGFLRAIQF